MRRLLLLIAPLLLGTQSYVPPPPPQLPIVLSPETVERGRLLFEENVWTVGRVQIYNYLGPTSCGSCHESKKKLQPESLANNFANLRVKMNDEIIKRSGGAPLPLQDPALEAMEQYLLSKYRLQDFKLSK